MNDWAAWILDEVYAPVFIDAIVVKKSDGQVASRPVYAATGASLVGEKGVLGLWGGAGGDGAKFWKSRLTDIKNRDVCEALKRDVKPIYIATNPNAAKPSSEQLDKK